VFYQDLTRLACVLAAAGIVMLPLSAHMPELSAFEIFFAIANTGSLGAAG
jgi:hypothetical protein